VTWYDNEVNVPPAAACTMPTIIMNEQRKLIVEVIIGQEEW
jgi:hypothetical protein